MTTYQDDYHMIQIILDFCSVRLCEERSIPDVLMLAVLVCVQLTAFDKLSLEAQCSKSTNG